MMKIISRTLLLATLPLLASCHNMKIDFEDFGETSVYFPYQTPARTLLLGKYDQGFNENDNNHCFEIGVTLTGVYNNESDRYVEVAIDNELLDGVKNVLPLPAEYYEVITPNPVVIPAGDFKGRIKVQLKDAFFNDPKAVAPANTTQYALPMKIVSVQGIDKVLEEKNYTLYGIKYINPYESVYLRRGEDRLEDLSGTELGTIIYKAPYVENDERVKTRTVNLVETIVPAKLRRLDNTTSPMDIRLRFKDDLNCEVLDSERNVIGSGTYVVDGDKLGGKDADVIHLEYVFTDTGHGEIHHVTEHMVVRNREMKFELFVPEYI